MSFSSRIGSQLGELLGNEVGGYMKRKQNIESHRQLAKQVGIPEEDVEEFVNHGADMTTDEYIKQLQQLSQYQKTQAETQKIRGQLQPPGQQPQIQSLAKAYGIEDRFLPQFAQSLEGIPPKDLNNVAKISAEKIFETQAQEKIQGVYEGMIDFYRNILEKNPQRLERNLGDKEAAHIKSQLIGLIPYIRKSEFGGSARGIQMIQQIQEALPNANDRVSEALEKLEGIGQGFGFDFSSIADLKKNKPDILGVRVKSSEEAKSQLKGRSFKGKEKKNGKESLEDIFG